MVHHHALRIVTFAVQKPANPDSSSFGVVANMDRYHIGKAQ